MTLRAHLMRCPLTSCPSSLHISHGTGLLVHPTSQIQNNIRAFALARTLPKADGLFRSLPAGFHSNVTSSGRLIPHTAANSTPLYVASALPSLSPPHLPSHTWFAYLSAHCLPPHNRNASIHRPWSPVPFTISPGPTAGPGTQEDLITGL